MSRGAEFCKRLPDKVKYENMFKKHCVPDLNAVIFDIDGTMVDNIVYHEKAWLIFCKKYNVKMTGQQFKTRFFGKNNHTILQGLFRASLTKQKAELYAEEKESLYRQIYAPHIRPLPGLNQLIKRVKQKGIKTAIASGAPQKNREFVFKHLNLAGEFDLVVGDEDVENGKPHPEIYLQVANRLKVKPDQCLVFEDTPAGVESAKSAGMQVVGILTGYSKKALRLADCTINNYNEL